jgi:hypothetical protein
MGLVRTALIFGAGYAVGHPAGRAKVLALLQRPEVEELRRKAADTASSGIEAGKRQLAQTTGRTTAPASPRAYPPPEDGRTADLSGTPVAPTATPATPPPPPVTPSA